MLLLSYQLQVEFKVINQACPKVHMVYPYMNKVELPQLLAFFIYVRGAGHRITISQGLSGFFRRAYLWYINRRVSQTQLQYYIY
jgi:hypothetical protein